MSVGPFPPERDELFRSTSRRIVCPPNPRVSFELPWESESDLAYAIQQAVRVLGLEALPATPRAVFTTLHTDTAGNPRVLFVINPSPDEVRARVFAPNTAAAMDALTLRTVPREGDRFEVKMAPRTVVMLELSPLSPSPTA